ncbi:MAG: hypothetical protein AAF628_08250 [Planctomycetota bacterium]
MSNRDLNLEVLGILRQLRRTDIYSESNPAPDPIGDTLPTGTVRVSNTAPRVGETLSVISTIYDPDGIPAGITYRWQRAGQDIPGGTASTYVVMPSDEGFALRVVASFTDGQGNAYVRESADTAPVSRENTPATGTVTIDDLNPTAGVLLTATVDAQDAEGVGPLSYQWWYGATDSTPISGATAASYQTSAADVGQALRVSTAFTDGQGNAESLSSDPTAPVAEVPVGGGPRTFRWNPGLWANGETNWGSLDFPTYEETLARISSRWYAEDRWLPYVKGVRLRFNWRELERVPNELFTGVIQAYIDSGYLVSVVVDPQANNQFAGVFPETPSNPIMAVPSDLAGDPNSVHWFVRTTGKNRALARLWDTTPAGTVVRNRFRAVAIRLAEWADTQPMVESIGFKGELALGSPGSTQDNAYNDANYNTGTIGVDSGFDRYLDYLLDLTGEINQRGGEYWLQLPANGLGSDPDVIASRTAKILAFADSQPGIGFRQPDCYTRPGVRASDGKPYVPHTDWDAAKMGQGLQGLYGQMLDFQRPENTYYNGTARHWEGTCMVNPWNPDGVTPEATVPPGGTNFSHGATHPVLIPNEEVETPQGVKYASEDAWFAVISDQGTDHAFMAFPTRWTELGAAPAAA